MLHAFNTKNVRRVLALPGEEHSNDKNEDAVTSMVFSPLAFMTPAAALEILVALAGDALATRIGGRPVVRHDVQLWPASLAAKAWAGADKVRCEPDLLVRFDFAEGRSLFVVGEMKWDWRASTDHILKETTRQLSAVRGIAAGADIFLLVITKHRLSRQIPGASQRTWVAAHAVAARLRVNGADGAARIWGGLVADFLLKARLVSFQGFRAVAPAGVGSRPLFWAAAR